MSQIFARTRNCAGIRLFALAVAACPLAGGAKAAVTISTDATQNIVCADGVCMPTARNAVLNAADLEALLASGDVTVTTTGSGVQAHNIEVKSAVSWSSGSTLEADAQRTIAIDSRISVTGLAGVVLQTGDSKGRPAFGSKGSITFSDPASVLTINGTAYTLEGSIKSLANDIASNPSGHFALAANYDASGDGTYRSSPIPGPLVGTFEGLGNSIANFTLVQSHCAQESGIGLFSVVDSNGVLADIGIANANIRTGTNCISAFVGTLAGINLGTIESAYATGKVAASPGDQYSDLGGLAGDNEGEVANSWTKSNVTGPNTGGLVGFNGAAIDRSHAAGAVSGVFVAGGLADYNDGDITNSYATTGVATQGGAGYPGIGGGLAGINSAVIDTSFAMGAVTGSADGYGTAVGGLVGANSHTIENSWASGAVTNESTHGNKRGSGGLVGQNKGKISFSYSTGIVTGTTNTGGLIGYDNSLPGKITDTDWDTDTSGITDPGQGAGNRANDPGITGLTTAQFQSGLPAGFDPAIWAEDAHVDDGLPYLIANPPPK